MLGIRLKPEEEAALERHARALGRPKSALVRDWIRERLERDSIDAQMRRTAKILASHDRAEDYIESDMDD
jgi:predicted transcriptional regulator